MKVNSVALIAYTVVYVASATETTAPWKSVHHRHGKGTMRLLIYACIGQ